MLHRLGEIARGAKSNLYRLRHSSSVDLAVTGLSRSGKTVFITSLIQNLLSAGVSNGQMTRALPAFEPLANGRLREVILPPSGARNRPRFAFDDCLSQMASEAAKWPRRTGAVSEIELAILFGRNRDTRDRDLASLTLRLVDYPGEWLLDLPLLEHSFEEWSAKTLALSRQGPRATLSERWRSILAERDFTRPNEDSFARLLAEAYRDYLVACRESGLRFLQPGQFLRLPGQDDESSRPILDRPQLWFSPIPAAPAGKWPNGSMGAAMAKRYDAYCSETVKGFLTDTFGRFGRQLVLVDVLGALSAGEDAFNDTCRALSEVSEFLRVSSEGLWNRIKGLRVSPSIDKIAFVATKADHVPRLQRQNLANLLGRMLRQELGIRRWRGTEVLTTYLSSVCATEEDRIEVDGQPYDAVVGCRIDTGKRAKVIVTPIPGDIPDRPYWQNYRQAGIRAFDFPIFKPPPFNTHNSGGIPQIGMERLLNFLIGDRFE